jgi:hypothetical protein
VGVKCHVLNIGSQSANWWIVQEGKVYFSQDFNCENFGFILMNIKYVVIIW